MGVKCKHYKLCSVQSKLVYFLQFWGMKHFLGPVCDIWPYYLCIPIGVRIQVLTIVVEHYYCIVVPIIVSAPVTGPRYKHTDSSILVWPLAWWVSQAWPTRLAAPESSKTGQLTIKLQVKIRNLEDGNSNMLQRNLQAVA